MTAGFDLLPGPYDRLDPVARALRWQLSRLAAFARPQQRSDIPIGTLETQSGLRLAGKIIVTLQASDVFLTSLRLPPASPFTHRKAIRLKLPELAPLEPDALHIVARGSGKTADGAALYRLAMARRDRIARAEAIARTHGARDIAFRSPDAPDLVIVSPRTKMRRRNAMFVDLALGLALLASAVAASTTGADAILRDAESLAGAEREVRRVAVARERTASGAALSAAAINEGVMERRPGQLIEDLAAINDATPDGTWWTGIQWSGQRIDLSGASPEAAPATQALSDALAGWSVALSGSVRPNPQTGGQQFQLRLTRRSEPQ